jgi:hypothetical protein
MFIAILVHFSQFFCTKKNLTTLLYPIFLKSPIGLLDVYGRNPHYRHNINTFIVFKVQEACDLGFIYPLGNLLQSFFKY